MYALYFVITLNFFLDGKLKIKSFSKKGNPTGHLLPTPHYFHLLPLSSFLFTFPLTLSYVEKEGAWQLRRIPQLVRFVASAETFLMSFIIFDALRFVSNSRPFFESRPNDVRAMECGRVLLKIVFLLFWAWGKRQVIGHGTWGRKF